MKINVWEFQSLKWVHTLDDLGIRRVVLCQQKYSRNGWNAYCPRRTTLGKPRGLFSLFTISSPTPINVETE